MRDRLEIIRSACQFLNRFSLTAKMLALTFVVGAAAWFASDYFAGQTVQRVFTNHLEDMMREEGLDARTSFDRYVKSHAHAVKLIVSQKSFLDYIEGTSWPSRNSSGIISHKELPLWLPRPSVLRQFVDIRYALLLDDGGRVREAYQSMTEPPPAALLRPTVLLRQLSHNQSLLTELDGQPFLVASESVTTHLGNVRATLMLASPIDEQFLVASQRAIAGGTLVALIAPGENRIMASNRFDLLPPGTGLEELEDQYLVTGKGFFDYGSSDLALGFATFISTSEVTALGRPLVVMHRFEHTIIASLFILSFTLIMLWVTKRISRLTGRVEDFSMSALGGRPGEAGRGDQLDILEKRFHRLTAEVTRSHDELEKKVEERTEELRKERDRAQRYLDVAGVMFIVLGADEQVVLINKKGCEILGYEENEITGRNWFEHFIPERIRGRVRSVFEKIMSGVIEPVEYFENPVLTKGGEERMVAWHNILLRDNAGNAVGTLSSGEDVTYRKQAEEERNRLIITLNTLVEHLPEGVFLLDAEYRVVMANPVAEEYLMSISEAETGDTLTHLANRPLGELLVSPPHILWHEIAIDGHTFEVAGRSVGTPGAPGGMVFVLRDVTEDRKIGERMQQQERLAAVGQLAAGIAHDFNNILTIITGYAEVLLTDMPLSPEVRQGISAIMESGKKAADLIHQVLDFSRKTVGEMEDVPLIPFLKEFLRFIERAVPEDIHISLGYEPADYVVKADVTKLQQVLANLVMNARDAMPRGGELMLKVGSLSLVDGDRPPLPEMSPGQWVSVTVSDTGEGIRPDILPHIFEPFFTTKMGKGTGLGLSQVYGLVKQHQGHIDVKTGKGGTSFTVYLPVELARARDKPAEETEAEVPRGQGQTVLVVEDDTAVRELVKKVLESLGYKVLSAINGREALEIFDAQRAEVGLVITDVVMPEIDGIQLSRVLKSRAPSIKVMALTGYSLGIRTKDLEAAGVEEVIRKPFKVQALAEAVSRLFAKTTG